MKLFGRNKKDVEAVPSEVQDYYKSERRERIGLAWLLALGTLVVTLIIAAGLFFGGRWAYRKITGNDNRNTATTQQQGQGEQNSDGNTSSTNTEQNQSGSGESNTTPQPSSQNPTTNTPGATAGTNTANGQNNGTTPAPNSTALVNTGPGDMVAIFVVTAVAGALAHHLVWVRRHQ